MDPICLIVAGAVRATLPGPEFTLAWEHSVQKSRWEETYRVDGDALTLIEARVQGSGAGMEPPPAAVLRGGWWSWAPQTSLPELRITRASYTSDYEICWRHHCAALGALVGTANHENVVVIRGCGPDRMAPSGRAG